MPSLPLLMTNLGRVIRRLRAESGYSQERFGFAIGLHRTYMGHLERGTANPTIKTLDLVARGLGITVPELFALTIGEETSPATAGAEKLSRQVAGLKNAERPAGRRVGARGRKVRTGRR